MLCLGTVVSRAAAAAVGLFVLASAPAWGADAPVSNPCTGLGVTTPQITAVMPTTFGGGSASQPGADCLAWQEFIYENWRADPKKPGTPDPSASASTFGTPGDTKPKVWETYVQAAALFRSFGMHPPAFDALPRSPMLKLTKTSKLGDAIVRINNFGQAGDNKWLTDQRGDLTYYDVRLNQDDYDFITGNAVNGVNLTTYKGQLDCALAVPKGQTGGFNLPGGNSQDTTCAGVSKVYGLNEGTIEIKSAWVALPADHSLDYRFLTADAELTDPFGQTTKATVGLVGLHIIHKMVGAPQFVWATFEQIDNDPDFNNGQPSGPMLPANPNQTNRTAFTFFNPSCQPSSDPYYKCVPNTQPGKPCIKGSTTSPTGCDPYTAPVPVARVVSVGSPANDVTGYVWSLLGQSAKTSVFNYYRLIDVQWPNSPSNVPAQTNVPLTNGGITPNSQTRIMANSTLETYMQTKNSCMDCHQYAGIAQKSQATTMTIAGRWERRVILGGAAPTPPAPCGSCASGYSFVFGAETKR